MDLDRRQLEVLDVLSDGGPRSDMHLADETQFDGLLAALGTLMAYGLIDRRGGWYRITDEGRRHLRELGGTDSRAPTRGVF